jgi:hypothetical protein
MDNQIVENGHNTSYIMSLFTALFYESTNIMSFLNKDPKDKNFIYLQEFIRENISNVLHRGYSVHSSTMNELRNYICSCGWKETLDEMLSEHDVGEFFLFFMKKIHIYPLLEFDRLSNDSCVGDFSTSLIKLTVPEGIKQVNLSDLYKIWLKSNVTMDKFKYKLSRHSVLLPFYINRPKNKVKLDIMQKIKFFDVDDKVQELLTWYIHSIICHREDIGYYTIIKRKNKWVKILDKSIPSFIHMDMEDTTDVNDISENAVIAFYRRFTS